MSRKIIGVTVGTSISPEALKKKMNIEPGSGGNAVLYTAQTLTEEQKAQARKNIGVGGSAFDPTVYGLPVLYLTGDTAGMSKDDAVTLDYAYGERAGTAEVKWQGSSSLAYPKKNYAVEFDNAFVAADGWGEQKNYCLKANHIDHSHARNVVSAKLWGQIVKSRPKTSPSNAQLFDASKISHFTNQNGVTIDWARVENGSIIINSFAYNDGYNYAIGQTFSEGDYTISFDAVSDGGATIEGLWVGFGVDNKICQAAKAVGDSLQTPVHFEFSVTNTNPNAYFFVVPTNATSRPNLKIQNISIVKATNTNLFDIAKVTHLEDIHGNHLDWAYKNDDTIRVKAAVANNGYPFLTGQKYGAGEYTITFDAYNDVVDDANNINVLTAGFGDSSGVVCEKTISFAAQNEWFRCEVSVTNTIEDASLFVSGYFGVGNHKTDLHFKNIQVTKQGGESSGETNITYNLQELVNGGAIDGFPVVIMLNNNFHGLYTFNIPKDGWMLGMGEGENEAILCADYSDACEFKGEATLNGDFDLEYVSNENNAAWVTTSVNRLINACMSSDGTDLDTTISQYLDWESAIDYYIFTCLIGGMDMGVKNYLLSTYDGTKWFFGAYDMDSTFGLWWDGTKFLPDNHYPTVEGYANYHKLMWLIWNYKRDEFKARYAELRSGALSENNVALAFSNFISRIPSTVYAEDAKKWPSIPSTAANNLAQILNWYRMRAAVIDKEVGAEHDSGGNVDVTIDGETLVIA